MQKWLPDAFDQGTTAATAVANPQPTSFQSDSSGPRSEQDDRQRLFKSESGFVAPEAIMNHLTPEERAQVFELVELDISRKYEAQENDLKAQMALDLEENRRQFDQALGHWSEQMQLSVATHLKETADQAARLAIRLAEKIVRETVNTDNQTLVRALETTLFKIDGAREVTVSVNPEEAEWLENQADFKEKLGVSKIVADRRVDKGGCRVRTEKREWDATVKGQLATLSEMVEEMIATADAPVLPMKDLGGPEDESGLD